MKKQILGLIAAAASAVGIASAAVEVFVWEDGSDLRVQAEGTIDLTGMTPMGDGAFADGIISIASAGVIGAVDGNLVDRYDIEGSQLPVFGPGNSLFDGVFSGTNSILIDRTTTAGVLWVSQGFQSGGSIFAAATSMNQSLASIGANIGVYVWTLPNDVITVRIGEAPGSAPVPVPPAMALFGIGVLALYRKAKRA
ncbi:MAG: hypothetical protein AAF830_07520 [Pseudomonadota bacterium]